MKDRKLASVKSDHTDLHTSEDSAASGRDEMNLVEFPLTLLTEKATEGQTTLRYSDVITENGKTTQREVIVTGSPEWGLPTAKDEDVLVGLLQLTKAKNAFTDAVVPFTRLDLIELLGWPNHHWSYTRLAHSFARWQAVNINYHKAWRDNRNREWTSKLGFGLIDSFELTDARKAGTAEIAKEGRSWFRWNGHLFDSFRSGYLKKLDYSVYKSLESQIAKRLYRYLDKQFYGPGRQKLDFDLRLLVFEHLGLSRNYDAAQIKRKLQPALEELEGIGFLEKAPARDRYTKVGWGKWKITVARKRAEEPVSHASNLNPTPSALSPTPQTPKTSDDVLQRLQALPRGEQLQFEAAAVASASPYLIEQYRNSKPVGGPFFEATRRKILADHFARSRS
jgi:hypothetical protein